MPLQAGDQLPGHLVQVRKQVGECLAGRLLHRQRSYHAPADEQMIPIAFDGRIGDEVVQVRVMRQRGCVDGCRVVVQKLTEEAERLAFRLAA